MAQHEQEQQQEQKEKDDSNNNNNKTVNIEIKVDMELDKEALEKVLLDRAGVKDGERVSMRKLVKETVGKMDPVSKQKALRGETAQLGRTLDVTEMMPTKYQPKASRQFIIKIDGIDTYLVKSFERGEWSRKGNKKVLTVEIYDPIAPSGEQQVREWLESQTWLGRRRIKKRYFNELYNGKTREEFSKLTVTPYRSVVVMYLDPVGTCISEVEYTGVRLERVEFSKLDYDYGRRHKSELVTLKLEMSYKEELFKF